MRHIEMKVNEIRVNDVFIYVINCIGMRSSRFKYLQDIYCFYY